MKRKISLLLVCLLLIACIPASLAFGIDSGDYKLTFKYGESAAAANATITCQSTTANPEYTPGFLQDGNISIDNISEMIIITQNELLAGPEGKPYGCYYSLANDGYDSEKYEFTGWRLMDLASGTSQYISTSLIEMGAYDDGFTSCPYVSEVTSSNAFSRIKVEWNDPFEECLLTSSYTIEPIFTAKAPTGPSYTFSLESNKASVNGGQDVNLTLYSVGGDYNQFSAEVTYDPALFTYKSVTTGITADTTESGVVKLTGTGLAGNNETDAAVITFTAKSVTQAGSGTFGIRSAKAGTSTDAVSADAPEAAKGEGVSVGVNASQIATVTVTLPNSTTASVTSGDDYKFTLADVYTVKDGYTYTVKAGDFTVTDHNDGTYTINDITADVTVEVSEAIEGLTTDTLTVGTTTYKVAVLKATPQAGKVFMYDGGQMIKSSVYDGYVYIIGSNNEEALSEKVTEADGTEIALTNDGDVNQTGKIDINDAQLVSDLYNGTYTDGFATVAMIKWLAADVNGNKEISTADIAAVVGATGFEY